jgi:hypothetical protein
VIAQIPIAGDNVRDYIAADSEGLCLAKTLSACDFNEK